jgi:hypothetical protein
MTAKVKTEYEPTVITSRIQWDASSFPSGQKLQIRANFLNAS